MEPMYVAIERGINILSYVYFSKICDVIQYFPELKQNIIIEDINFLSHKIQERLNGETSILEN